MSSKHQAAMELGNDHVFDIYGQDAVYTPPAGEAVSCTVIAGPVNSENYEPDEGGRTELKFRQITVATAEVASPVVDGIITIDSEDWQVTEPPDIYAGAAVLQTRQDAPKEKRHTMGRENLPSR